MPGEFLQYVLRQQLQNHAYRKVGLLQLIAFVYNVCEVQVELANMWEANILGIEKGSEPCIVWRAHIQSNFVVELSDGDFVKLLAGKADIAKICWAVDLDIRVSCALKLSAHDCGAYMLHYKSLQVHGQVHEVESGRHAAVSLARRLPGAIREAVFYRAAAVRQL